MIWTAVDGPSMNPGHTGINGLPPPSTAFVNPAPQGLATLSLVELFVDLSGAKKNALQKQSTSNQVKCEAKGNRRRGDR